MFEPSPLQEAIFSAWTDREPRHRHISVNAVAGSGKSTTLEHALKRSDEPSLFAAFNKHIVEAAQPRFADTRVKIATGHSIGMQTLNKHLPKRPRLDDNKYRKLVREYLREFQAEYKDDKEAAKNINQLIKFTRLTLTDYTDLGAMIKMANRYNLDFEIKYKRAAETLLNHGQRLAETNGEIDFTDMLYLPARLKMQPYQFPRVAVDECQDLSTAARRLIMSCCAPGGRMLFVGDPYQCQPAGTAVRMANGGPKPIEEIAAGDQVITYDRHSGSFVKNGLVSATQEQDFEGLLYTVFANGHISACTPNHKWLVRWTNRGASAWITYLMRQGGRFRVGKTKLFLDSKRAQQGTFHFGLAARCYREWADAAWILKVHTSEGEAVEYEQIVSALFGIPQIIFQTGPWAKHYTQPAIDRIYEALAPQTDAAVKCLLAHKRDPRYPIWSPERRQRQGRNTVFVTEACNLINDYMAVPVAPGTITAGDRAANWHPVNVSSAMWRGTVYSLEIAKHHLYVADNLLTHNSIMAFAGADANSYHEIHQELETLELPLSICYRCPADVVKMAQEIVPQIEARPGAPSGTIDWRTEEDLHKQAQAGDLIMCRKNAPLLKHCLRLIRNGIHARIRGRDVGKELANLIRNIGSQISDYGQFPDAVEFYYHQQKAVLIAKDASDAQLEILDDKCNTVSECFAGFLDCRSVDELAMRIESIFSDYGTAVWFSSIHRAKGLEADRTWILEFDRLGELIGRDSSDEEAQTERNLKYVAVTRSLDTLFLVKREK